MATSIRDLLIRLNAQVRDLNKPAGVTRPAASIELDWRHLASAAHRVADLTPADAAGHATRRLQLILGSFPTDPGPARPSGSLDPLLELATALGAIADLLTLHPQVSQAIQQVAGVTLADRLQGTLGAAATWSLHAQPDSSPLALERPLRHLAGYRADPSPFPPLATAAWRLTGCNDPGLDGAVARWAVAAQETVADPRTASQLGLQLGAAGIALICRNAAAVAGRLRPEGPALADAEEAAVAWERAAMWPADLHLGGRSTYLRDASANLREAITNAAAPGGAPAEHQLEVAHSALQTAWQVGGIIAGTLHEVSYGASRVWTRADQVLRYLPSPEHVLAATGKDWLPDAAGIHSAKPLHQAATNAQQALTKATKHYLAAAGQVQPPAEARGSDQDLAWEVTTAPNASCSPDEEPLTAARRRHLSSNRRFV